MTTSTIAISYDLLTLLRKLVIQQNGGTKKLRILFLPWRTRSPATVAQEKASDDTYTTLDTIQNMES